MTEPYYPFHSSAVEEFTIGSERCGDGGRAYCNGPLKPNTKYYVKLRAYTAPDKFTDTAYTVLYTGELLVKNRKEKQNIRRKILWLIQKEEWLLYSGRTSYDVMFTTV